MFPVLFSFGPFTLYTIGVFLVLAFFISSYAFWRKGREEHYLEDELFDAFLLTLFWGVLVSRAAFIGLHFDHFGVNLEKWLDIFAYPGMLPLAGLVVAALYLYSYSKKQKWDPFEILDFASISVAIAQSIVWIGAFFDGSGFGYHTTLPWGMNFPSVFDKRHPIQLYGAALYFLLFLFLIWAEPRYRTFSWYRDKKHSAQTGFLFCTFLIAFGLFGAVLGAISSPQIEVTGIAFDVPIRIIILVLGVVLLLIRSGKLALPKRTRTVSKVVS